MTAALELSTEEIELYGVEEIVTCPACDDFARAGGICSVCANDGYTSAKESADWIEASDHALVALYTGAKRYDPENRHWPELESDEIPF